jgi:hypothetical protein
MKIWLAYKFRDCDFTELRSQLENLIEILMNNGHEVFTMIKDIQDWDPDSMSKEEAVRRAHPFYEACEAALCLYATSDPSEGRGFDAGVFVGQGKPTIMALHNSLKIPFTEALYSENPANARHHLPSVIRYEHLEDIARQLKPK